MSLINYSAKRFTFAKMNFCLKMYFLTQFQVTKSWCSFCRCHFFFSRVRHVGITVCGKLWKFSVGVAFSGVCVPLSFFNRLTPNDPYMGRTAPLTSKRCILYIYSTNIGTEYFKHALYSPFFFSSKCSLFHNANLFGSRNIHILYTGCAKIKKIIPAPKG